MMILQDNQEEVMAASRDELHARLDAALALPPEYRGGLSSHLPMALQALQAMGADARALDRFAESYGRRFEPGAAEDPEYAALRWQFARELAESGRAATLRRALPVLLQGVAAAAFHGAIRTAHAIEAEHEGELAAALAYWAWRWQGLATPLPAVQRYSFEVWAALLVEGAKDFKPDAPMITTRMRAAMASPLYAQLAVGPWPVPDLLRRLAGLALERYLVSGNFTVLHMVTGLRAVRVLRRHAGEVPGVDAVLLRAFVAACMAAGVVERPRPPSDVSIGWAEVSAAAIAQDDDHVIKLVHACREEFAAYGDPRYLQVAAMAVARCLRT